MQNGIEYLIPQRPPVVMIDALTNSDDQSAETRFHVHPDNIFCRNNVFTEYGIIENIAQTAAAFAGYQCQLQDIPVPEGYIAAIKNLEVFNLPSAGSTLHTRIIKENEIMGITIVKGKCYHDERLLASCEMRILINNRES